VGAARAVKAVTAVSRVRRGHAADHRVRPHAEIEDPAVPGTCQTCRLPTGTSNVLHRDHQTTDIAKAEARRIGERTEP
jgi:hypothetical protein